MAKIDVTGTLYWETGLSENRSGRVEGAVLKYQTTSASGSSISDDDGDFNISGIDDSEDLALVLLHEIGRPLKKTIKAGHFSEHLSLRIASIQGRGAQIVGGITLGVFVFVLAVLISAYQDSHNTWIENTNSRYSELIGALNDVPTTNATAASGALSTQQEEVRDAKLAVDILRVQPDSEANQLIEDIVAYNIRADTENFEDLKVMIRTAVEILRKPEGRFFWSAWPWILVELWYWGLFGVLLTKIVRIGWYLRSASYHPRGTWMHIAHVVATPFLALLAVLVLSFLKIEGESETIVALNNPLFMVVTACLLSTNPWGLWDFILGQGDALRERATSAK